VRCTDAFRFITAIFFLAVTLAVVQCADAAITITRTSSPIFYSDIGNGLSGGYVAYRITTDSAINDGWAQIGNFSGPNISLAPNETGLYHLGYVPAGSKMAYFYLKTSAVSTATESHTVSVYDGRPPGGSALGSSSFSLTQQNTIQANSNKVSSVVTGPATVAGLGSVVTLTVTGDTGNTGGTLSFTAATDPNWPASAYKLFKSVVNLPDNSVLTDQPYSAAYYGITGTYVAVYSFIAEGTVTAPAATNATGYILSGQQMKHTQVGGSAGAPPPPTVSPSTGNTVLLGNSVSYPPLAPGVGGKATFTLHLTNNGTSDVTLDDIVNTLPTAPGAASYLANSSTFNGSYLADPVVSGAQLTWSSSFVIPAGGSRDLVFVANIPGNTGTYTDSAIAHIGTTVIDTTYPTTDNAPAISTVTVAAVTVLYKSFSPSTIGAGKTSTLAFTISNSSDMPYQSGLAFTDTLPIGLTLSGTPATPQCGGTVSYSVNGAGASVISFTGGSIAANTASCTINTTVTGNTDGLYTNSYAGNNIGNLSSNMIGTGVNASLQVSAPTVGVVFAPSTINSNQTSTMMFTINNGTGYPNQSGLGFSESLPSGLVVVGSPTYSQGCSWTYAVATDNKSFSLSAGTMTAGTQNCTVTVPVAPTSSTATTYTNYPSNVGVSGSLINGVTNQQLVVTTTPTLKKVFNPQVIGVGLPSVMTFTINNSSGSTQSNLSFSDLFPGGLVVAGTPAVSLSSGCTSGSVYRYAGTTALQGGEPGIQVSNVAVAPNSSCTISVNVTSTTTGSYLNTWSSAGNSSVSNLSGLVYAESNMTTLNVVGVKLTKAFGDAILITGGTTPLTFTITNQQPDQPAQGGIRFTDNLPNGLTPTGTPTTQCGGTVSYSGNSIVFSGGSLAQNAAGCTITAYVTSTTPGPYTNSYPTNIGNLPTSGVDASGANATLNVYYPPALTVVSSASPASQQPGRTITYTVQVTNTGGPATNVIASDTISPYTSLVLDPFGNGTPFWFRDGTPSSNLYLAPGTPLYSVDGVTWSSTPSASSVYWKIPLQNTMNGAGSSGNPNFTIQFQGLVK
jgi:mucin-19